MLYFQCTGKNPNCLWCLASRKGWSCSLKSDKHYRYPVWGQIYQNRMCLFVHPDAAPQNVGFSAQAASVALHVPSSWQTAKNPTHPGYCTGRAGPQMPAIRAGGALASCHDTEPTPCPCCQNRRWAHRDREEASRGHKPK